MFPWLCFFLFCPASDWTPPRPSVKGMNPQRQKNLESLAGRAYAIDASVSNPENQYASGINQAKMLWHTSYNGNGAFDSRVHWSWSGVLYWNGIRILDAWPYDMANENGKWTTFAHARINHSVEEISFASLLFRIRWLALLCSISCRPQSWTIWNNMHLICWVIKIRQATANEIRFKSLLQIVRMEIKWMKKKTTKMRKQ